MLQKVAVRLQTYRATLSSETFTLVIPHVLTYQSSMVLTWRCQVALWLQWLDRVGRVNPRYRHYWWGFMIRLVACWLLMGTPCETSVLTGCDPTWASFTRLLFLI